MLLAIDAGNTTITFALYDSDSLVANWRLGTDHGRTEDEYAAILHTLFSEKELRFSAVDCIGICSVVPLATESLVRFSEKHLGVKPLVVGPGLELGIAVRYSPVSDVGADRLANAVAAHERYNRACIVVDFGTATTFDAISRDGEYLGGAIAPGIQISLEALFSRAARLTGVELVKPERAIGTTTTESLRSGLVYGFAGQVDAVVGRMLHEMGGSALVVATGGHAELIAEHSEGIDEVNPLLTLDGIRIICERLCAK